jgi:hypothetical protein
MVRRGDGMTHTEAIAERELMRHTIPELGYHHAGPPFSVARCASAVQDSAFSWITSNGGICAEAAYPYTAADGTW